MRNVTNQHTAATMPEQMPFAGLGFAMDSVRTAAQGMSLIPHDHGGRPERCPAAPDAWTRPAGYRLLVTLGREIRGR